MLRSLRVRLTIWYVVLLAVILAAFSTGVYFAMRQNLYGNLDDSVDIRAQTLSSAITFDPSPHLSQADAPTDREGESFVIVFNSDGKISFNNRKSIGILIDDAAVQKALSGTLIRDNVQSLSGSLRVLTQPIERDGRTVGALQLGLSEGDVRDTLNQLLLIIAIAYPLTLLVASAGGVFLAGRALAPIDRLSGVARRITAEDLHQRIDLDLPDDEVGRLAHTLNDMIARLDEAFTRQRRFTADASHELRTPLTVIKGQTEVALQRDRDVESYKKVLQSVNGQVDRMIRMSASLLTLARADAGQIPMATEPTDIERIVGDAAEQMRVAADANEIELQVSPGPSVRTLADGDLLLQLMLNLLDNAVKYTPRYGLIRVGWSVADGHVEIRVSDTGPGIAAQHLPRIFDRFYRADEARSHPNGGAGLGLSISRWIAEAHGGSITAVSTSGNGTTFTVRLPASK
jgi:heavy metal sensor kinase